ncbi:MAG: formylglycine-generating enzyme family protein [Xenococcus sp. MO_188.B8]|nr:formylglycine-generating enzyme family protein [Xenococcus sp. MO_188.B8]
MGITGVKPVDFDSPQVSVVESLEEVLVSSGASDVMEKIPELVDHFQDFIEDLGNGVELEMVAISGGTFMMGSPEGEGQFYEKPQHEVTVSSFYMGKYPITQLQYTQIMGKNPSRFEGNQRPVERVSWSMAVEFCEKLSKQTGREYRLPTESEWEYACRAGTTTKYCFGNTISGNLANFSSNVGATTSVGRYTPNKLGLYDMHGNVWEWCQDNWHWGYKSSPNDGRAWLKKGFFGRLLSLNYKVIRGGSWNDNPNFCRSAARFSDSLENASNDDGFRVVCMVPRT